VRNHERLAWNVGRLLEAARLLGVPAIATEQYPRGLGPTLPGIAAGLSAAGLSAAGLSAAGLSAARLSAAGECGGAIPAKLTFSAYGCEVARTQLAALGRPNVLVCGIETHVCVLQTALDLGHAGYRVFLCEDAVESRSENDRRIALRRLESAGATLTTVESALFEWCYEAGTPAFKQISQLVKQTGPS